jgi:MFS family permease
MMVAAPLGSFFMGWLMDRLSGKGHRNATVRTCAIAMGLAALMALAQLLIADLRIAMLVYVIQVFLFTSFTVATSASLAQLTPARLSGKLQAIMGLASSLVGLALGPTVVALVSENMFVGGNALHNGLVVTVAAAAAVGAVFYAVVASKMREADGLFE